MPWLAGLVVGSTLWAQEVPTPGFAWEGEWMTISVNETAGIPLREFLELTKHLTGKTIRADASDIAGRAVAWEGPERIQKADAWLFCQAVLFREGFLCVANEHGRPRVPAHVHQLGGRASRRHWRPCLRYDAEPLDEANHAQCRPARCCCQRRAPAAGAELDAVQPRPEPTGAVRACDGVRWLPGPRGAVRGCGVRPSQQRDLFRRPWAARAAIPRLAREIGLQPALLALERHGRSGPGSPNNIAGGLFWLCFAPRQPLVAGRRPRCEWDGSTWTQIPTSIKPAARTTPALAYDPLRGRVLLYGGYNPRPTPGSSARRSTTRRSSPTLGPIPRARCCPTPATE